MVNAQFALISSLPSLIPVLGFFVGGIADTLVLTKNQAMLVFKLAAIHGRNIDHRIDELAGVAELGSWDLSGRTATLPTSYKALI
jgi:uncharacterized protein (DUF697 family)